MQSTNPKDILILLQVISTGLTNGILAKEEVIDWADKIITKDEQPDIFFIDLALPSSKSKIEIINHFTDYINPENPVPGKPLLGLLYKKYHAGELNLERTVRILYQLNFNALFTSREENFIYSIDDEYDLARNNIYGSLEDVKRETENFLALYKDYSIYNFEQWQMLDKEIDERF